MEKNLPYELVDMCKLLEDITMKTTLTSIPKMMGRYFRLSNQMGGEQVNQLMGIRHPGNNDEFWSLRKMMLKIGEGENLLEPDVDSMLDVVLFGLKYGIGLILPSLPCVIQFQLLNMMKKKHISVVFASRSMAIGVNYPIRTTVIMATHQQWTSYPPSIMIQMAGRCGRRGKDTEGNVIYWGISNVNEANAESLGVLHMEDNMKWNEGWKKSMWKIYKNRNVKNQDEYFYEFVNTMEEWSEEKREHRKQIFEKIRKKVWMEEWSRDYSIVQDIMTLMNRLQWMHMLYHQKNCIECLYLLEYMYVEFKKMQYHLLHFTI
jgi:hypothetical protein